MIDGRHGTIAVGCPPDVLGSAILVAPAATLHGIATAPAKPAPRRVSSASIRKFTACPGVGIRYAAGSETTDELRRVKRPQDRSFAPRNHRRINRPWMEELARFSGDELDLRLDLADRNYQAAVRATVLLLRETGRRGAPGG